jgi:hypothetical protein
MWAPGRAPTAAPRRPKAAERKKPAPQHKVSRASTGDRVDPQEKIKPLIAEFEAEKVKPLIERIG